MKQELSYDAWGKLRNPSTQAVYTPGNEPALFLGRGYTGHEHLPWFGLVNMNARLYDSALGRFLSPDPYVQMSYFSQNFNRYSYCLNNPLLYIDEDGEFIHLIIGAIIGGTVNLISNWKHIDGNIWKGLGYFGVGAAAGVAGAATGGLISGVGFIAGATSGAMSGFASGAILGAGNAWMGGASFGDGLMGGLKGGLIGAASGAAIGGTVSGIQSVRNGGNFLTGKGYSKISELALRGDDLELGGDAATNKANLKTIQEELGWNEGDLGVNKMDIDGYLDISNTKSGVDYFRADNGIINRLKDNASSEVRGFVATSSKGLFSTKTDMYLSFHQSLKGLKITVNHELIHSYHALIGLNGFNNYSEYSALSNTTLYMPQYRAALEKLASYRTAPFMGYSWPKYLLPIRYNTSV